MYAVKKEHLRRYVDQIQKERTMFKSFKLIHVPRENPRLQIVDNIVNKVLDEQGV